MCEMKKPLVILTGPTAVGKTTLSLQLAKRLDAEIISADSMQIYRYMNIGSAKIRPDQMQGIPHHLVDLLDPADGCNVARFAQLAAKEIEDIHSRGKIPLLVGGTGFYIQAVLYCIDFTEMDSDPEERARLAGIAQEQGNGYLHDMLREVDPQAAADIPLQNTKRVIRALEYYYLTGEKISAHNREQRQKESPYRFVYFVLTDERDRLYERINRRVDEMMEDGLLEEVMRLRERGYTRDLVSMQGLGYKELLGYLDGEGTLDEAVEKIKQNTRHFAKRQLTWFRRERDVTWIDKAEFAHGDEAVLEEMVRECTIKGII